MAQARGNTQPSITTAGQLGPEAQPCRKGRRRHGGALDEGAASTGGGAGHWDFVALCYARGFTRRERPVVQRAAVIDLAAECETAAITEAVAWIGRSIETRHGDVRLCGVQIARVRKGVARPLPARADLLLVDERGNLPATRLHSPRLSKISRAYLRSLAAGVPLAGAPRTIGALRRMGLLSLEGAVITDFAWRLFGAQLVPGKAPRTQSAQHRHAA